MRRFAKDVNDFECGKEGGFVNNNYPRFAEPGA